MRKNRSLGPIATLGLSLSLSLLACAPDDGGLPILGASTKPKASASPGTKASPSPTSQSGSSDLNGSITGKESPLPIATSPSPSPTPTPTPTPFTVQVSSPLKLAIDGSGNAWITCHGDGTSSGSATKMGAAGEFLKEVLVGVGPDSLVVDGSGNLWVANTGSTVVSKVTSEGVWHVDVGSNPRGLALDGSGNLWVAAAKAVVKLSLSNHATQSVVAMDAGGVTVQVDKVWVTDRANGRVSAFSPSGVLDRSIQTGSQPGVVKISGSVLWVLNHASNSLTRIDTAAGDTKSNHDPGGASPADLAFDASGNAWVSVPSIGKVTKFAPSGAYLSTLTIGTAPCGLAFAPGGKLWVTDRSANRVHVVTP